MSVSDIVSTVDGPRINMTWSSPVIGTRALSVQISKSIEFIGIVRTFVIPPGGGISIDAGNGLWFFRVGAWHGTPQTGVITWSGIHGPVNVATPKLTIGIKPSLVTILHTQAITHGIRIHTGINTPYYVISDISKNNEGMGASVCTTQYTYDVGRGYFDVTGLDYMNKYNIKIATFQEAPAELPTDSIKQLGAVQVTMQKRPARQLRAMESGVSTTARAEDTLLRDLARQPKLSFASHADYLKYVAAKAKTGEEIR